MNECQTNGLLDAADVSFIAFTITLLNESYQ